MFWRAGQVLTDFESRGVMRGGAALNDLEVQGWRTASAAFKAQWSPRRETVPCRSSFVRMPARLVRGETLRSWVALL